MTRSERREWIHESAQIDPTVRIGPGVVVGRGTAIGAGCKLAAGAILDPGDDGNITLGQDVYIEPGAVITGTVTVGQGALVSAGAVVGRDVPPHAIVAGCPAQITGYTVSNQLESKLSTSQLAPESPGTSSTGVRGVSLHRLPKVLDLRGNLTAGEFGRSVPFEVKRYFMVFGVPNAEVRGEHAHRTCHQFLVCAHGNLTVMADDGTTRGEFVLDDPSVGVHLPPLTWGVQYKYSSDAVLLVLASEYYDADEYIRDYREFIELATRKER